MSENTNDIPPQDDGDADSLILRATCALCGYSTTSPSQLELWNGYGDCPAPFHVNDEQQDVTWVLAGGKRTRTTHNANGDFTHEEVPTPALLPGSLTRGRAVVAAYTTGFNLNCGQDVQYASLIAELLLAAEADGHHIDATLDLARYHVGLIEK